ncbi:MAG TPA: hypothetical protein VMS79_04265 [Methanomassiliicoccales archaeon]|nr:hypothetical protein [Methanomassiliicoccales archaeon]
MFDLLSLMMKEEYRLHVSYSSSRVFFSLPLYVALIAFFMATALPSMEGSMSVSELLLLVNGGVFVYGLSVGAFGFLGQALVERRAGRANFIVAMPFLLPFTFRRAFGALYVRDIIFYLILIIVPGVLGVLAATVFIPYHLSSIALAATAVTLSFLLGISFSFLVSVVYVRSRAAFVAIMAAFVVLLVGYGVFHWYPLDAILPSLGFQDSVPPIGSDWSAAASYLVESIAFFLAFSFAAVALVAPEPLVASPRVSERYAEYDRSMGFFRSYRSLLAKDFLDMSRSGAASKMLLAYVAPLVFLGFTTWYVNHGLHIPVGFNTVFFAAMVGSFGVMFYSWLTNLDTFDYYETLPVSVPRMIRTKLISFFILTTIVSTAFVLLIAFANGETRLLWVALPVLYITSAYSVIATAYLTGLSPNSVLFSPSILSRFAAVSILPDICITILSFSLEAAPLISALGIALVCTALLVCTMFFYRGLDRKWLSAGFA